MERLERNVWSVRMLLAFVALGVFASCNPFAPGLDENLSSASVLGDRKTIDGIFQNVKYSYTFRDTTIYGQMLNSDYVYIYRDYDRGVDVSWGRDEELRITRSLFQNVQNLDLVWNQEISRSVDSTSASVSRNFNLTVTFNPSDIIRIDGYITLSLARNADGQPWRIVRWRDESNF